MLGLTGDRAGRSALRAAIGLLVGFGLALILVQSTGLHRHERNDPETRPAACEACRLGKLASAIDVVAPADAPIPPAAEAYSPWEATRRPLVGTTQDLFGRGPPAFVFES